MEGGCAVEEIVVKPEVIIFSDEEAEPEEKPKMFNIESMTKGIWYGTIESKIFKVPWFDNSSLPRDLLVWAFHVRSGCNKTEDLIHFLLECDQNKDIRDRYLDGMGLFIVQWRCKCNSKSTTFRRSDYRKRRKRVYKKSPRPCPDCGKIFDTGYQLNKHARTHSGTRPYMCSACGKAYTQPGHLAIHTLTHQGGVRMRMSMRMSMTMSVMMIMRISKRMRMSMKMGMNVKLGTDQRYEVKCTIASSMLRIEHVRCVLKICVMLLVKTCAPYSPATHVLTEPRNSQRIRQKTDSRVEHSKRATSGSLLAGFPVTISTYCTNARCATCYIIPRNVGQYPPYDNKEECEDVNDNEDEYKYEFKDEVSLVVYTQSSNQLIHAHALG
ncbi:hypothetical protein MSG28_014443 [Choristoneura fumiferana]|uniref:Uncharacterized protein n=1 Tax=Choristoneura fumiferana TaxID=7141 RepID=A0ACC0JRE8_CHOFU|nr:hypothetical protein MSG28_014443 [Choristoneura fumiferana]